MTAVRAAARRPSDRREAARAAMLDAAIGLLATRGYTGMTLADVGRQGGYSHGLTTFYFGSKAELAAAVAAEADRRKTAYLSAACEGSESGLDYVRRWVNANFEFVRKHPEILRAALVILVESVTTVPEVQKVYQGLADRNARILEEAFLRGVEDGSIRAGVDPYATSVTLSGAVLGMNYQWLANPKLDVKRRRVALLELVDVLAAAEPAVAPRAATAPAGPKSTRTPAKVGARRSVTATG